MIRGISVQGLTSALGLATLTIPLGMWAFGLQPSRPAVTVVQPPSIAVIQSMSELATTRVHISDFIDGENDHYRGRWTLHGEVLIGVDLAEVTYVQSHPEKREAVCGLAEASAVDRVGLEPWHRPFGQLQ